jgi:aminopeptidase 2
MLRSVVGDEKFFRGVSLYLKKHLYGNAQTKDLWAGVSEAVGSEHDIAEIMANWVLKIGFPVLTVEESAGEIKVTQNRFLSSGDVKPEEDETIWWVPLGIKTIKDGRATVDKTAVLSGRSAIFKVDSDVFKLNAETVGVYRVAYSAERLVKLGQQGPSLSVEDRVGILSDASALATAGYTKTSAALSLFKALAATETEYLAFSRVSAFVNSVGSVWWENDEVHDAVNRLRIQIFRPIVDKMGYDHAERDSPETKQLRALAVASAGGAGDETVIAEVQKRFQHFVDTGDDSGIAPELQGIFFTIASRHGGELEYNKMLDLYNNPPNPSTKVDASTGLCRTCQPDLLDKTFAMLSDVSAIKDQDLVSPESLLPLTARHL